MLFQAKAVRVLTSSPTLQVNAQLGEMPSPLLWGLAVAAFGVLLIVSVLILLRRQPEENLPWDIAHGAGEQTGRYLQHLHRLLRAIRAMNSVIVTERDRDRLMEKACRTLTTTRGYKMAWIGLVQEGNKRVIPAMSAGMEEGYLENVNITWDDSPQGQGPTGRSIKTGEPYIMRDIETAPEFRPWREEALQRGYRSSASLPLRCHGRVLGSLNVYSEMPDAFDIEEVGLLQEVADHLAYALAAIERDEELALARTEARAAADVWRIFQNSPTGMMSTDAAGDLTTINPAMVALLDRPEDAAQLVGSTRLLDLGPFGSGKAHSQVAHLLSESEPVSFECMMNVNGAERKLRITGSPINAEDGELTGTVWYAEQIA